MTSIRQRTLLLKLAASGTPLAARLCTVVKKAAEYSVAKGDTLSSIAQRNGTTWQALAKLNNLANPDRLSPGQRLVLPPPKASPVPKTPLERLNAVSTYLHKKLGNPNLEAAVLANLDRETGGKFDYSTKEVGGGGYGLPQYTGASLKAYKGWLASNKRTDSMNSQLDYFTDVYMPSRAGYKTYVTPGAKYTREQYADWLHRRVFTPAHTIASNASYSLAKILKYTLSHNAFMKNRLKSVNGVWQGVKS